MTERRRRLPGRERRDAGSQVEIVAFGRVGLERRRASPERSRLRELPAALEQVREVPEGPDVVGRLAEQEREFVARVLLPPEPLLEDGGATQAHRTEHLNGRRARP